MPKSVQIIVYEAVDGTRFDSIEKCAEHEVAILDQLLKSLNPELIKEALKRAGLSIRADRSNRPVDMERVKELTEQAWSTAEARQ